MKRIDNFIKVLTFTFISVLSLALVSKVLMLLDPKFLDYLNMNATSLSMFNNRQVVIMSVLAEIVVLLACTPLMSRHWRDAFILAFCVSASAYHAIIWFEKNGGVCPCLRLDVFGIHVSPAIGDWLVAVCIMAGFLRVVTEKYASNIKRFAT